MDKQNKLTPEAILKMHLFRLLHNSDQIVNSMKEIPGPGIEQIDIPDSFYDRNASPILELGSLLEKHPRLFGALAKEHQEEIQTTLQPYLARFMGVERANTVFGIIGLPQKQKDVQEQSRSVEGEGKPVSILKRPGISKSANRRVTFSDNKSAKNEGSHFGKDDSIGANKQSQGTRGSVGSQRKSRPLLERIGANENELMRNEQTQSATQKSNNHVKDMPKNSNPRRTWQERRGEQSKEKALNPISSWEL